MGRLQALREPAIPILLTACVAHVVRRNLFDLLLFSGTAVLIVLDSWRTPPAGPAAPSRARPTAHWRIWLAILPFAVLAAPLPQDSAAIQWVLGLAGLTALAVLLLVPVGSVPTQPARRVQVTGWWVWATLGVLGCLWELTEFIVQQVDPAAQQAHPTMSDLVGPLLADWPGRLVFLVLWAAGGVWLMRRLLGLGGTGGSRTGGSADRPDQPGQGGPDSRFTHHLGSGGAS